MHSATREQHQEEDFEQYRTLLFSIAYRMTGSANDAEDLTQETYLRYQASDRAEITSLKAYLSTIITRLALDYLKSARVTREQYVGTWLPEPVLTAEDDDLPFSDIARKDELSLAFLRLLETLSPPERAVYLLHEVFDYPFGDIGPMLEKSAANCRQIYHRAQQALHDERVRFQPEPQRQRQLLEGFLSASQAGNMAALTNLLAQDAISWTDGGGRVRTILTPVRGRQAVAAFWLKWLGPERTHPQPLIIAQAEINGGPAILYWQEGKLAVVVCLSLSDAGIQDIYAVLNPDKLAYLQRQLAARGITPPASD